jgi:hypothetical protein
MIRDSKSKGRKAGGQGGNHFESMTELRGEAKGKIERRSQGRAEKGAQTKTQARAYR